MEYTKGEWKIKILKDSIFISTDERLVAKISEGRAEASEVSANARLIASAPDLYEALREVKLIWQGLDPNIRFPHLQEVIDKAIAKVGRS